VMKCAIYSEYYHESMTEVCQIMDDHPLPKIDESEVLVKVHATSLNAADWKMAQGYMHPASSLPIIPCMDFAGVVVQTGKKVRTVFNGDEVYGYARAVLSSHVCGCAAEYVAVHETSVCVKPNNISFIEAASLPLVAVTAFQSIYRFLEEGCKILVLGGGSGTGAFGIQLAKAKGAFVATTCSERNLDFVQKLGVDMTINYKVDNWYEVLAEENDWDVVYDCVGDSPKNFDYSKAILKPGGAFVTITGDKPGKNTVGKLIGVGLTIAGRKIHSLFSGPNYHHVLADSNQTSVQLPIITELIESGLIIPTVTKVFPLDEIAEAYDFMSTGAAQGKIAISVVAEYVDTKNPELIIVEEDNTSDLNNEENENSSTSSF